MTTESTKFSESINHLLIKRWFYDNIPLFNDVKTIKQEIKIGDRIADIYIELMNGNKIVIEIQHSKISKEDLHQRTREYNQNGIYVLWVLDGNSLYDKNPRNEDGVFFSISEKELQLMYKRRVYYINAGPQGVESPVYALHFAPYFVRKISRFGIKYFKNSKTKRSAVYGDISSLKLTMFRNRGFKLASFLDKDLKSSCIDDVVRFLDSFIAYRNSNYNKFKKKFAKGLPLRVLTRKFQIKYGLYLLFDVLRTLKYLKVQDADYMFIERYSFNKYLQI